MKVYCYTFFLLFLFSSTYSQTPGNVGTANLTSWFKPDGLTLGNVTNWTTTFPTGGSAITLTDASAPYPQATNTPTGATSNYNTTIDFVGNTTASLQVLGNASVLDLLDNASSGDAGTFICAYYLPATYACGGCHIVNYREATSGTVDGIQFRVKLGSGLGRIAIGTGNSSFASRDWTQEHVRDIMAYVGNRSGSGTMNSKKRSLLFSGGVSSGSTGYQGLYFGVRRGGLSSYNAPFDGFLNEVIFYNKDLSALESSKVYTYLAIKYGVTLDNTSGGTQGDYVATNGTTIWDASINSTYHNDLIGIGRDDNEGLLQKQSHTFDDTTRIYISTLQASNVANTGTFGSDVSYVVVGDNKGNMCATVASNAEMPPCGLFSRLEREWKVTKTDFTQTYNTDFTLNACATPTSVIISELRLLVDDDGDFSNGGTSCYFNGDGTGIAISYSNPVITVANISGVHIPNNSTQYITIGSINVTTPLPVELLNFDVKCNDKKVVLNWTTASEINNDYFTVERSTNGVNFEEIARIQGAGNSNTNQYYKFNDDSPMDGISYYRIKQTDFDGKFEYSDMKTVECSSISGMNIYPNPFENSFTIQMEEFVSYPITISIQDYLGRNVYKKTIIDKTQLIQIQFNDKFPPGSYFVKVFNKTDQVVKKITRMK